MQTSTNQNSSLNPTFPPLTGKDAEAAVSNQILYYPQVVRSNIDEPISEQHFGAISFQLLEGDVRTKDGKRIFGFFKLRGNWASKEQATSKASRIVREQDSKHKIRVANVGHWLPICDDNSLVKENIGVNLDDNDEEEIRRKAEIQTEKQKRQVMREMKEREEEIKNAKDLNEETDSLDHYTMKRVVWMRMRENMQQLKNQSESLDKKYEEVREKLRELDASHPNYEHDWIENYNKERRKAGIPDHVPSKREEEEYNQTRNGVTDLVDREIAYHTAKLNELLKQKAGVVKQDFSGKDKEEEDEF
ncbi:MAG TPA: hypothetical protein PKD85_01035 [Saprospiraceae bacterium]|nr:hypothetical protein [Saprospiraceae bacterium]